MRDDGGNTMGEQDVKVALGASFEIRIGRCVGGHGDGEGGCGLRAADEF